MDACLTPVLTQTEALDHPLAKERKALREVTFKEKRFHAVNAVPGRKATDASYIAELGEHSEEILKDWLGVEQPSS